MKDGWEAGRGAVKELEGWTWTAEFERFDQRNNLAEYRYEFFADGEHQFSDWEGFSPWDGVDANQYASDAVWQRRLEDGVRHILERAELI